MLENIILSVYALFFWYITLFQWHDWYKIRKKKLTAKRKHACSVLNIFTLILAIVYTIAVIMLWI